MRFTTSLARAGGILVAGALTAATLAGGASAAIVRADAPVLGGPGATYPTLGTLAAGTPVEVGACRDGWCRTQYGYVSTDLLAPSGAVPPAAVNGAAALGYGSAAGGTAQGVASGARSDAFRTGPRVTIGVANVRAGPSTDAEIVRTLPDGATVEVTGCANGWCRTEDGYVSIYLLAHSLTEPVLPPSAQPPVVATAVTAARAELRSGPGAHYAALGPLPAGTPVEVGRCAGAWCRTQYGYVRAEVVGLGVSSADAPARPALRHGHRTVRGTGWGPGSWGPGLSGPNWPGYWGARPSYWGGRPSYWNMHPGYGGAPHLGGPAPASRASVQTALGPRGQGPYDAGPWYDGRPVVWRP